MGVPDTNVLWSCLCSYLGFGSELRGLFASLGVSWDITHFPEIRHSGFKLFGATADR